jgi:MYXO-CTERM domain-containing protein
MKKAFASLLATGGVPLAALFALTAGPALLYAETGVLPSCAAPEVAACSAKASGETCVLEAGVGTCSSSWCIDVDGGLNTGSLVCLSTGGGPDASPDSSPDVISGSDASPDANSRDASSDAGSDANSSDASSDAGSDANSSDASSDAGSDANSRDASSDAGSVEKSDASPTSPGAVDSGTSSVPAARGDGCGCSTVGESSSGVPGSVAGLLLAACVIFGARRRTSKTAGAR